MKEYQKDRRILGAVLSSVFYCFICLIPLIAVLVSYFYSDEKMPIVAFIVFLCVFGLIIWGNIWCLIRRLKEINTGEEEEASKY